MAYEWNGNNPISNTDPSGHDPSLGEQVSIEAVTEYFTELVSTLAGIGGFAVGTAGGVVVSGICAETCAPAVAPAAAGAGFVVAFTGTHLFVEHPIRQMVTKTIEGMMADPGFAAFVDAPEVALEGYFGDAGIGGEAFGSTIIYGAGGIGITGYYNGSVSNWRVDGTLLTPGEELFSDGNMVTVGDTLANGDIRNADATLGVGQDPIQWASVDAYEQYQ